jgi:hypothetical protein
MRQIGSIEINAPVNCVIKLDSPRRHFSGDIPPGLYVAARGDIAGEEVKLMACRGARKNIFLGLAKITDAPCRRCSLFDP